MKTVLVLKNIESPDSLVFENPTDKYLSKVKEILSLCWKKNGGYVCVTIENPHKPRTLNQNALFWKLAEIIADHTGCTKEEVEEGVKDRAVSERNYPCKKNAFSGIVRPASMTGIDTIEMGKLIDTEHQIIAELGIILPPNL